MNKDQIDLFFSEIDQKFGKAARVIITGAAAGILMGHVRPSIDIDFEIRAHRRNNSRENERLEQAIKEASKKWGIAFNFSDNLGRWSMLNLLDYRDKARFYKKIGHLQIKVMDPAYWTIGKMGRFVEVDIADIETVIQKKKLKWGKLADLWGRAFQASHLSLEKGQFRDHVIYFLQKCGPRIWGKEFDTKKAIGRFKKSAGLITITE